MSDLYYISCTYVQPMNCMVLGYKQYKNTVQQLVLDLLLDSISVLVLIGLVVC